MPYYETRPRYLTDGDDKWLVVCKRSSKIELVTPSRTEAERYADALNEWALEVVKAIAAKPQPGARPLELADPDEIDDPTAILDKLYASAP